MKKTILRLLAFAMVLMACHEKPKANSHPEKGPQSQIDSLQLQLDSIAKSEVLPGFAVSIFSTDRVLYQEGFGFANLRSKSRFRKETVQLIASVTKTLVGVALMKAVEGNLLNLDDPINDILPYSVVNPYYPKDAITVRMLASHTSTLAGTQNSDKGYRFESPLLEADFPEAYKPLLSNYNKTETLPMSEFLQRKLTPNGEWYEKELFTKERPGTSYAYSNLGIALLAHIIEIKTQVPFDEYTREFIIDPLTMKASFWKLEQVPTDVHTTYYNELRNEVPNYHIITYPDGGLYSSIADMTKFLQEMMKGYEGRSELLSQGSFREMMKKQFEGEDLNDGLCWDLSFEGLIGHSGNDFGTATLMYFSPESGIGRILFTNISIETEAQENAFYGIFNTLFAYDFR